MLVNAKPDNGKMVSSLGRLVRKDTGLYLRAQLIIKIYCYFLLLPEVKCLPGKYFPISISISFIVIIYRVSRLCSISISS